MSPCSRCRFTLSLRSQMMNMSSLMPYTCLLIFYCFTFVCIYGGDQDLSPSCEVGLMVRRGTTLKAAPQQRLTVKCPVKHCGESLNVIWCKLHNTDKCEQIKLTENVEIMQNDKYSKEELASFLIFKRISINDDGLYRCDLKGYKDEQISHTINISVSDLSPSCEVVLMVRRGTTMKAAPQQRVTVECPVKHCGEPLNVTWCKLLDTDKCEPIKITENVEIMQNDKHAKDELASFLTFKRISIHDDGLYRCDLKGYKDEQISHTINISVSDLHQGVYNNADLSHSCEVALMVQRGTTLKAAPQQLVKVKCPVKHCGESLNVIWCKLHNTDKCEQIKLTENVEIMQNDKYSKDELTSFLIFKRISINDDGLYRCDLKGHKDEQISHTINISVSDLHQGVYNNSDELSSVAGCVLAALLLHLSWSNSDSVNY